MGRSLSWIVVEGSDADTIARTLGVKRTGETGRADDFRVSGRRVADGRYLVVSNNFPDVTLRRGHLAALSRIAPLTRVQIVEAVTASLVEKWSGGDVVWSVEHAGDQSTLHMETSGQVPDDFAAFKKAALEKQQQATGDDENVDFVFDLPLDFAAAQNGVTYENDIGGELCTGFEKLETGLVQRKLNSRSVLLVLIVVGFFALLYLAGAFQRWLWAAMGWN